MVKNTNKIKEKLLKVGTGERLFKLASSSAPPYFNKEPEWYKKYFPYLCIVYIDDDPERYVLSYRINRAHPFKNNLLKKIIERYKPEDFNDYLLIASFYHPLRFNTVVDKIKIFDKGQFYDGTLLDEMLSESKGLIAYKHQLDAVYRMLTGCTQKMADKFCRAFFEKECWALAETEILKMYDGKRLSTILEERMFDKYVCFPNYLGAMHLYECCCGNM